MLEIAGEIMAAIALSVSLPYLLYWLLWFSTDGDYSEPAE
jgi:hypothetical protein